MAAGLSRSASLRDEAVQLLQQLIRLNTANPPGNETQAAELLCAYLEPFGVECELYARVPERAHHDELLFQTTHQSSELWLKLAGE